MNHQKIALESSFLVLISIIFYISLFNDAWSQQSNPLIVSTRNVFDTEDGTQEQNINTIFNDVSSLIDLTENDCPGELVIYVHGVWASQADAFEQTERVFLSLQNRGYTYPVVGYSWDSDTAFALDDEDFSKQGWKVAKKIANGNGPLLAKFILGYKDICPTDNIRIIAHSLGARVTLSALSDLHKHFFGEDEIIHANEPKTIESVHLLGAAINLEQISTNPSNCLIDELSIECSGRAIESQVQDFYNYYNTEDNMISPIKIWILFTRVELPSIYQQSENNIALGSTAIVITSNVPDNFHQDDVTFEIPKFKDSDSDGTCDIRYYYGGLIYCTIFLYGDNHQGYIGFRDSDNNFMNNGAIDNVVNTWNFS
jgi:hypothetical protein